MLRKLLFVISIWSCAAWNGWAGLAEYRIDGTVTVAVPDGCIECPEVGDPFEMTLFIQGIQCWYDLSLPAISWERNLEQGDVAEVPEFEAFHRFWMTESDSLFIWTDVHNTFWDDHPFFAPTAEDWDEAAGDIWGDGWYVHIDVDVDSAVNIPAVPEPSARSLVWAGLFATGLMIFFTNRKSR